MKKIILENQSLFLKKNKYKEFGLNWKGKGQWRGYIGFSCTFILITYNAWLPYFDFWLARFGRARLSTKLTISRVVCHITRVQWDINMPMTNFRWAFNEFGNRIVWCLGGNSHFTIFYPGFRKLRKFDLHFPC